jgi:hypothetical protein
VADPGRGEGGGHRPVDAVPQADEDAGGEPGFGLGQDRSQGGGRVPPSGLQRPSGTVCFGAQVQAIAVEGPPRPDPGQVLAVARVRSGTQSAVHGDDVSGLDLGIAGEGRREAEDGTDGRIHDPDRCHLVTVTGPTDGLHDHGPRAVSGRRDGGRRGRRDRDESDRDECGADGHTQHGEPRPRGKDCDEQGEGNDPEDQAQASGSGEERSGQGGAGRADGEPPAARHVSPRSRGRGCARRSSPRGHLGNATRRPPRTGLPHGRPRSSER